MYTLEAAYIFSMILLVIATILTGAMKLQSKINGFTRAALENEIESHLPEGTKEFQPEKFIRMATLFEQDQDPAEGEHHE